MADVQVTCITKPHPQSPHEHITHLGNPAGGWTWPREKVIESIDAKTNTFYVLDPLNGKRLMWGSSGRLAKLLTCAPTQTATGTTTSCR